MLDPTHTLAVTLHDGHSLQVVSQGPQLHASEFVHNILAPCPQDWRAGFLDAQSAPLSEATAPTFEPTDST
jgi:hypothetical protein